MQRQKDSVNLMTFIKPHQSGFLLSIILAVISVTKIIETVEQPHHFSDFQEPYSQMLVKAVRSKRLVLQ